MNTVQKNRETLIRVWSYHKDWLQKSDMKKYKNADLISKVKAPLSLKQKRQRKSVSLGTGMRLRYTRAQGQEAKWPNLKRSFSCSKSQILRVVFNVR